MHDETSCQVCLTGRLKPFALIEQVPYSICEHCKSIYVASPDLLSDQKVRSYDQDYWRNEIASSRHRSFGSTLSRIAEVFFYSRIPIQSFVDIGCGPGFTLDAIGCLMPDHSSLFYGVELFPPPAEFRTRSNNYIQGTVGSCGMYFSAGICIEVIEHMFPWQLRTLAAEIAAASQPNAIYYFNSAQPDHVIKNDPNYLDPYNRGHVASYSLEGLRVLFGEYDLSVIPLFGRDWAFLLEYCKNRKEVVLTADDLLSRLWTPLPENINKLIDNGFGPLMHTMGLESARCYLESAISTERALWALSLDKQLRQVS